MVQCINYYFFLNGLKILPENTQLEAHVHYYSFIYKKDCFIVTDEPEITAHPESVAETEGNNVTLSCNAAANPAPTISWIRDGSPVNTTINSRISFLEDNKQLTITNVNRTDSGEYRCVARNNFGNANSNDATLDIQCNVLRNSFPCSCVRLFVI